MTGLERKSVIKTLSLQTPYMNVPYGLLQGREKYGP
jgi:hypothetical protein